MNVRLVLRLIGLVIALLGLVWLVQGIGVLPGSFMTGSQIWAIAGGVTFLVGVGIAASGFRIGRRDT